MAEISVAALFEDTKRKLKLTWVAGLAGGKNALTSETVSKPSLALIGHLNFVHPNRVQVLGCAEMDYLRSLQAEAQQLAISNLFSTDLAAIVVANGEIPPSNCLLLQKNTLRHCSLHHCAVRRSWTYSATTWPERLQNPPACMVYSWKSMDLASC